jgi:hypothetical protein
MDALDYLAGALGINNSRNNCRAFNEVIRQCQVAASFRSGALTTSGVECIQGYIYCLICLPGGWPFEFHDHEPVDLPIPRGALIP